MLITISGMFFINSGMLSSTLRGTDEELH